MALGASGVLGLGLREFRVFGLGFRALGVWGVRAGASGRMDPQVKIQGCRFQIPGLAHGQEF